jgi:hypothetical protein
VKASRVPSWHFGDITRYCDVTKEPTDDGTRQIVGKPMPCPIRRLIVVFVKIDNNGDDRFYILPWELLRDLLIEHHKEFLKRQPIRGIRPKNPESLHCAIAEKALRPYQDKWDIIEKNLR